MLHEQGGAGGRMSAPDWAGLRRAWAPQGGPAEPLAVARPGSHPCDPGPCATRHPWGLALCLEWDRLGIPLAQSQASSSGKWEPGLRGNKRLADFLNHRARAPGIPDEQEVEPQACMDSENQQMMVSRCFQVQGFMD